MCYGDTGTNIRHRTPWFSVNLLATKNHGTIRNLIALLALMATALLVHARVLGLSFLSDDLTHHPSDRDMTSWVPVPLSPAAGLDALAQLTNGRTSPMGFPGGERAYVGVERPGLGAGRGTPFGASPFAFPCRLVGCGALLWCILFTRNRTVIVGEVRPWPPLPSLAICCVGQKPLGPRTAGGAGPSIRDPRSPDALLIPALPIMLGLAFGSA